MPTTSERTPTADQIAEIQTLSLLLPTLLMRSGRSRPAYGNCICVTYSGCRLIPGKAGWSVPCCVSGTIPCPPLQSRCNGWALVTAWSDALPTSEQVGSQIFSYTVARSTRTWILA